MNERRSLQLLAEKYELVLEKGQGVYISDETRNEIINMFRQGAAGLGKPDDTNIAKIAQIHNISGHAVSEIIRKSGVVRRGRGHTQRGSEYQPSAQRIPPAQIEYIKNLISKRDAEGVFEYSGRVIIKMVNEYTDAHPELDWYKIPPHNSGAALHKYTKEWEERNIPGETRADYGIKTSRGSVYRNKPKLPDNAGTWQTKGGPLGPLRTPVGRAQDIDDQAFLTPGS